MEIRVSLHPKNGASDYSAKLMDRREFDLRSTRRFVMHCLRHFSRHVVVLHLAATGCPVPESVPDLGMVES